MTSLLVGSSWKPVIGTPGYGPQAPQDQQSSCWFHFPIAQNDLSSEAPG